MQVCLNRHDVGASWAHDWVKGQLKLGHNYPELLSSPGHVRDAFKSPVAQPDAHQAPSTKSGKASQARSVISKGISEPTPN